MNVPVDVEDVELDGDYSDQPVPGVCVTCSRCDHSVEVYGDSNASVLRGLATLREECPRLERNWYVSYDAVDREG